jgi:LPS-assembly protein
MLHPRPNPRLCGPSRLSQLRSFGLLMALTATRIALAQEALCPSQTANNAPPTRLAEAKPNVSGPIEITSDKATLDANRNAVLQGNVEVRQGDRNVRAQDAQYDAATGGVTVKGSVEYRDPLVVLSGADGHYSADGGAQFRSAQFELQQRSARGAADSVKLTPEGVLDLTGVTFTTCPKGDQSWQIRAGELTLDTDARVGSGRNATVDFKGVPVLYLPWLSFPLGNERKSGFLFPTIGNSTRSGVEVSIPYYWNIAPNADLTFEPMYYSRRGVDLAGNTRFLTQNQSGSIDWHFLPSDNIAANDNLPSDNPASSGNLPPNATRSYVTVRDLARLDDARLRIDAANVSDVHYFEDFGQGPEGTSVAFVQRLAELTYRDEHWRLGAQVQQYQTIDLTLAETDRPYARLPRLTAGADFGAGPAGLLRYGFDSEVVDFSRADGVTGWRMDVMPRLTLDYSSPGYFIRPSIAWRYTRYALDNTALGQDDSPSRALPIASLDAGMQFERQSGPGGDRILTLEPRALYLYVPYRNQDQLPLFDTALPDLNLVQLFRTNRYVGADRVSDANQVSVGVTSRLLDSGSGQQFLAATLGQTYYFEPPRVQLPGEVPTAHSTSDLVAELALTAYKHWNADIGLEWNPAESRSDRTFVQVQFKPADENVVNVAYRYQRGVLDQAEMSGAWALSRSWNALARVVYAFDDNKALDRFLGFEYRSCCWRVRLLGRRFLRTAGGQEDTGVLLELELTGLASVGSAPDSFLGTAIRGYTRRTPTY